MANFDAANRDNIDRNSFVSLLISLLFSLFNGRAGCGHGSFARGLTNRGPVEVYSGLTQNQVAIVMGILPKSKPDRTTMVDLLLAV
jgi:hypothetical protein